MIDRHWALAATVGGTLMMMVGGALTLRYVSSRPTAEPFEDGPIVVLGGSAGDRLDLALSLSETSSSERQLVLSAASIDDGERAGRRCAGSVILVEPDPASTYGEARAVAALVEREGWGRVTVVTSDFHVTRARVLFARHLAVPVAVVGARTHRSVAEVVRRTTREAAGTFVALVAHRR